MILRVSTMKKMDTSHNQSEEIHPGKTWTTYYSAGQMQKTVYIFKWMLLFGMRWKWKKTISAWWDACILRSFQNKYIYIYIRAHIFKNKHAHSIELIITILSDLCSIQTRSTLEHIKPMFATNTPKKYQILWPSCDLLSSSSQAHLCRKYHPIEARKTLYTTWFILFRQYSPL